MVQWEGILDDSNQIEPVWFSRPKKIAIESSTQIVNSKVSPPPPSSSSSTTTTTEKNTTTTGSQDNTTSTNDPTITTSTSTTGTTTNASSTSKSSSLISTPNNDKNQFTWKPLRKCDCTLLNQQYKLYIQQQQQQQQVEEKETTTTTGTNNDNNNMNNINSTTATNIVYIDSGRKTINFKEMTLHPTYQYPYGNSNSNSSSCSTGGSTTNKNDTDTTNTSDDSNEKKNTSSTTTTNTSSDTTSSSSSSSSMMNNVEEICYATWFLQYDITSSIKDIASTTTSNKPSATTTSSNSNTNQPQQRMEYKDGTIVYSSPYILYPITNLLHVHTIEQFYQDIQQTISSSNDIQSILQKEIIVDEAETYKVQVYNNKNSSNSNSISLKLVPNETHWLSTIGVQFKPSYILQRGYNDYIVPNEDIETTLGSINHIIFVIHGIGEALFHRTDIQITGLIEQTNILRNQIQNKQYIQYQKQCQTLRNNNNKKKNSSSNDDTTSTALPPPPKRIEFIPIEWFSCLHGNNNHNNHNHDLMNQLQLITLKTIPALRTIANDVLLDVLLYCTPKFCTLVLQTVLQQIIYYYNIIIHHVHPNYIHNGGTFSIIGHSLGTVITWDLLSLLKQHQSTMTTTTTAIPKSISDTDNNNSNDLQQQLSTSLSSMIPTTSSYGPSLIRPLNDVLPFTPHYTFLLGSPIGLFLTLRNARDIFLNEYNNVQIATTNTSNDSNNINNILRVSSFTLPTKYLYNIFHPSDPVAYRIEPLLINLQESIISNIQNNNNNTYNIIIDQKLQELLQRYIPEPVYLTVPGEDVRLHIKALQFTNVVRKSLFQSNNIISSSSLHNNNSNHSGSSKTKSSNDTTTNNATAASSTTAQKINSWTTLLESAVAAVGNSSLTATTSTTNDSSSTSQKTTSNDNSDTTANTNTNSNTLCIPLGGMNQQRVDYVLQPPLVDNEYISAVTAHGTYFTNSDVQDFFIGLLH